ncbi:MAG: hypothetical protein QXF12_00180 [Candidatus Aenigmatarchaeota archaeon]
MITQNPFARIDHIDIDLSTHTPVSFSDIDIKIIFRVGVLFPTSIVTVPNTNPDEKYILISSKDDFINVIGPPNYLDSYMTSVYYLSGKVEILVYNDVNDVREQHNIMIFFFPYDGGINYVSDILSYSNVLMDYFVSIFANVRDISLIDKSLYNITSSGTRPYPEDFISLFFGGFKYDSGIVWAAAESIYAFAKYFKEWLIFCGMKYKSSLSYYYFERRMINILANNNVNFFQAARYLINPVTASGLYITDEITYNFLIKSIRYIFNMFVGYPNNPTTWMFIRDAFNKLMRSISLNKCFSIDWAIILDERNNNINLNNIVAEVHITGSTTRKTSFANIIKLNIKTS